LAALGRHFLIEYNDCNIDILDNLDSVREIMLLAAEKSGATVLKHFLHKFSPQGVTGVVIIAESHLAVHTWPEFGYAAVDIFTCGTKVDPLVAYRFIKESFQSAESSFREISRGETEEPGKRVGQSSI